MSVVLVGCQVHKSMHFFLTGSSREFGNCICLCAHWLDSIGSDRVTQELHLLLQKLALGVQPCWGTSEMCSRCSLNVEGKINVINVWRHKVSTIFWIQPFAARVPSGVEHCWGFSESKWHDMELVKAMVGSECCLLMGSVIHWNLPVARCYRSTEEKKFAFPVNGWSLGVGKCWLWWLNSDYW